MDAGTCEELSHAHAYKNIHGRTSSGHDNSSEASQPLSSATLVHSQLAQEWSSSHEGKDRGYV